MKTFVMSVVLAFGFAFGMSDPDQAYATGFASVIASDADWVMTECPEGLEVPVIACVFGSGSQDLDKMILDLYVPRYAEWVAPWVRSSELAIGRAMSTAIGQMHVMSFEVSPFVTLVFFWKKF